MSAFALDVLVVAVIVDVVKSSRTDPHDNVVYVVVVFGARRS